MDQSNWSGDFESISQMMQICLANLPDYCNKNLFVYEFVFQKNILARSEDQKLILKQKQMLETKEKLLKE